MQEKHDPVGRHLPTSDKKSNSNFISGVFVQPPKFFSRVVLQGAWKGSAGSFAVRSDPAVLLQREWYIGFWRKSINKR
jgi:hypothetical protein